MAITQADVSAVSDILDTVVLAEGLDILSVSLVENKIKIMISECTDEYASEFYLTIKTDSNRVFKFERSAYSEMILGLGYQTILARLNQIEA